MGDTNPVLLYFFRGKIVQLEKELEQKVEEISILEARIEQRHLQVRE